MLIRTIHIMGMGTWVQFFNDNGLQVDEHRPGVANKDGEDYYPCPFLAEGHDFIIRADGTVDTQNGLPFSAI